MKLSFSTNAFVRHSVWEAVEKIAAIGFEGVEVLADVPHLYAASVSRADLDILRGTLASTGLKVANVNANTAVGYYGRQFWEPLFEPSLANPDRGARAWRIEYCRKSIDIAHALGAPTISVTSGRPVPGVSIDESMRILKDSISEVLDHAMKRDIRVGIEYEPGLLIECCRELASFLDEMACPFLGANLDLGHSHVLGEDAAETISRLSPAIFHIHLEDIRSRKHYHLIPGTGDMDFEAIFTALRENSYRGFATVELYTYPHRPEEAARESIRYLRDCIKEGK